MRYYILMPDDTFQDLNNPNNILGEDSFNTFHAENGFKALRNIIDKFPEIIQHISIVDDNMQYLTVEQFLDIIRPYKILVH